MRLKEFIIFIIVFTILYIVFFIVYDAIQAKREKKLLEQKIASFMDINRFSKFAKFYGLDSITVTNELLLVIYKDINHITNIPMKEYSEKYHLSIHEFIITILYFEYCYLIGGKNISIEENQISSMNYTDQGLILRYGSLFSDKNSYTQIIEKMGNQAVSDLNYFNEHFLIPGVRILNSNVYYVGDINEEK